MSNVKVLVGHSLCDGTGRDTYVRALRTAPRRFPVLNVGQLTNGGSGMQIKCRPNSKAYVKQSQKFCVDANLLSKQGRYLQLPAYIYLTTIIFRIFLISGVAQANTI